MAQLTNLLFVQKMCRHGFSGDRAFCEEFFPFFWQVALGQGNRLDLGFRKTSRNLGKRIPTFGIVGDKDYREKKAMATDEACDAWLWQ